MFFSPLELKNYLRKSDVLSEVEVCVKKVEASSCNYSS